MPYPSPQEYNEAVQNPRTAFQDAELQSGRPELNRLGLPFARSGGFASVYKMEYGPQTWAVRCFKREVIDQQQRYRAISAHLAQARIPYTVAFSFLERGIRVKGQWYPVLKMDWVQGDPLNLYIEKHLNDPPALLALADRWVRMVEALQGAGIAHGDLQHGNVLVASGDYRLIDYDGMYVPALKGQTSNEVGLPNYQHPRRTGFDFGPEIDNFSAWVVYVSLVALSIEPSLWQKMQAGDDCLLFRKEDFERPHKSRVFRALERNPNQSLQLIITRFKSFLDLAPLQVPRLGGTLATPGQPTALSARSGVRPGPAWLADHVGQASTPTAAAPQVTSVPTAIPVADASWVFDHKNIGLSGVQEVRFENSPVLERIVLAACSGGLFLLLSLLFFLPQVTTSAIFVTVLGAVAIISLNVILWAWRFHSEPGVRALGELVSKVGRLTSQLHNKQKTVSSVEREKGDVLARYDREALKLERQLKDCERAGMDAIDTQQKQLGDALVSIRRRRLEADSNEQVEIQQVQRTSAGKVATLSQQIASTTAAEANELRDMLHRAQSGHVDLILRQTLVRMASIPGIGPGLTSKLLNANIQTAADVTMSRVRRVKDFGPARARAVVAWRQGIESRARANMPQSLPQQEQDRIRWHYAQQQSNLQAMMQQEQRRAADDVANIHAKYNAARVNLDHAETRVKADAAAKVDNIRSDHARQAAGIKHALARLKAETAVQVRAIEARMSQARLELSRLNYETGKLKRELENARRRIRLRTYLKRVVFLAR